MSEPALYSIEVSSNAKEVLAALGRFKGEVTHRVANRLVLENNQTLSEISLKRMSFPSGGPVVPGSLRHISGNALRSIRATPPEVMGELAIDTHLGSNLTYLAAQEGGFQGMVAVRAHTRRRFKYSVPRGTFVDSITKVRMKRTTRTRRVVNEAIPVKAHQMAMNLVARHMFSETITDAIPRYSAAISDEVVSAWNATAP